MEQSYVVEFRKAGENAFTKLQLDSKVSKVDFDALFYAGSTLKSKHNIELYINLFYDNCEGGPTEEGGFTYSCKNRQDDEIVYIKFIPES